MESNVVFIKDCEYTYLGNNTFNVKKYYNNYTSVIHYDDTYSYHYTTQETVEYSSSIIKKLYPNISDYLTNPYLATFLILGFKRFTFRYTFKFYQPKLLEIKFKEYENEIEYSVLILLNPEKILLSIGDDIKNLAINPKELINFL